MSQVPCHKIYIPTQKNYQNNYKNTKIPRYKGKVHRKKSKKKLTSVSFMYVCVAKNGEMLVFFSFFFSQQ